MTLSLVALVTDVVRDGRRVVGYAGWEGELDRERLARGLDEPSSVGDPVA
jgi:hypothetical protein